MRIILALILAGVLSSCQTAPTKGANQTKISPAAKGPIEPVQDFLRKAPIILDSRTPLDFSVSHTPGAINIQWQDFSRTETGMKGLLIDDSFSLARRLSLWGIDPTTPVLVVGEAQKGQGEEGRVAWMLKFLGIKDVQISSWQMVRATIPREEMPPQNKPIWKPEEQTHLMASKEEFLKEVFSGRPPPSKARKGALQIGGAVGVLERQVVVLDVSAFERKGGELNEARVPIKKIFWKSFITEDGTPDLSVITELDRNNITKNKIIYVISENGVSSGLVTFVLRELGYQAKNFAGGYDLLKQGKR